MVYEKIVSSEAPNVELSWTIRRHLRRNRSAERLRRLGIFAERFYKRFDGDPLSKTAKGSRIWAVAFAMRMVFEDF